MDLRNISVINIIKVVVVLGSLIAAFWAIEDRYFTTVAAKEMQQQTIQSIEQLQRSINLNADIRLLGELQKQKRTIKREIKQNPNDQDLKEEYQEIVDEINRVKARIEKYR